MKTRRLAFHLYLHSSSSYYDSTYVMISTIVLRVSEELGLPVYPGYWSTSTGVQYAETTYGGVQGFVGVLVDCYGYCICAGALRPMLSENKTQKQNRRPVSWNVFCGKRVLADVLPGRFYKTLQAF